MPAIKKKKLREAKQFFNIGDIVQLKPNLTNSTRSGEILKKKAGHYAKQVGKYVIVARRGQGYLIWPTNTNGPALAMLPFAAMRKPHKKLWWQPYYNLEKATIQTAKEGRDITMTVSETQAQSLCRRRWCAIIRR